MITPKLLEQLVPEKTKFSREWTIVAAEGDRVVGMMKGGDPTRNGNHYDQTYCEIFTTRSMRHLKPDPVPRADLE